MSYIHVLVFSYYGRLEFLTYYISRTWRYSCTGSHVGNLLEPDIKEYSARRWTLREGQIAKLQT